MVVVHTDRVVVGRIGLVVAVRIALEVVVHTGRDADCNLMEVLVVGPTGHLEADTANLPGHRNLEARVRILVEVDSLDSWAAVLHSPAEDMRLDMEAGLEEEDLVRSATCFRNTLQFTKLTSS